MVSRKALPCGGAFVVLVESTPAEGSSVKVLVTGADGFVGEHLVEELLATGHEVAASTLTLPPTRDTLSQEQLAAADWKAADVRDHDALYRLIAAVRPDQIYHLAGFASGALARARAAQAVDVNAGGTVNLCEAIVAVRDEFPGFNPRIFVMGSGDSYGDVARDDVPVTEEMGLRPVSTYGLSKAAQELAAHTYRRARDLRVLVVRSFNLVGPGQAPHFVVPDFCTQVARIVHGRSRAQVLHVGNLDVERDFTDVRDGVQAFRMVMELERPAAAYNVASGRSIAIRQILDWILDEADVRPDIVSDASRCRPGEIARIRGDAGRIRSETGWAPKRDIEASVREVYRWIARRYESRQSAADPVGERVQE
ncbi:MAG: NAD-dependent epimerase/dehydratase family protein [Gemmatimonadales bacterium]|nr:MAG: NAD-dependent epimerase/dehydratase family protein [Gemmatimonadales bacterium]